MSIYPMTRTLTALSAAFLGPAVFGRVPPDHVPPKKAPRSVAVFPSSVRSAMDARRPERTFYSEVSVTYHATPRLVRSVEGGVPSDPTAVFENRPVGMDLRETPATEHFTIETTEDTVRQTHWGDEDGFRLIDYEVLAGDLKWERENYHTGPVPARQEQMMKDLAHPSFALVCDGALWSRKGNHPMAAVTPLEETHMSRFPTAALDVSALGTAPMIDSEVLMWSVDSELGIPPRYAEMPWETGGRSERVEGTLQTDVLMLEHNGERYRLEWVTDESKGGQPVRATFFEGDRELGHSVTTLEQMDGRWFPKSVTYYRADFVEGRQPYLSFGVDRASFDEPWHRQTPFTPGDIGCVFGTQLSVELPEYRHVQSKLGAGHSMVWDGVDIIPFDEYRAMILFYGMEPHPSILQQLAVGTGWTPKQYLEWTRKRRPWARKHWLKHCGPIDIPARPKNCATDDWDLYVDAFVKQHRLSGGRKANAYRLLQHCKGLRDWHQTKYKKALEKAKQAGDRRRARKLEKPVDRIFKSLKRALVRLTPRPDRHVRTPRS